MRIELPNGVVIDGIPEGTSKEEIKQKVISSGLATAADFGEQPQQPQSYIEEAKRQLGLTGRYLAEGLANTADIVTEPIRVGLNAAGMNIPQSTTGAVQGLIRDLPQPETPLENVVGTASKFMASGGPFVGAGQMAAKSPGIVGQAGKMLSAEPKLQAASMITGGAAGETAKQAGYGEGTQLAATVAGGLSPVGIKGAMTAIKPGQVPENQVVSVINEMGIDLSKLDEPIQSELMAQVRKSLDLGVLDEEGMRRLADYRMTGAIPTQRGINPTPANVTQQANLAKAGANSSNPDLQQLANIENDNARILLDRLKTLSGGQSAVDLYAGGDAAQKSILHSDNIRKQVQGYLYNVAREKAGREIPLNRQFFIDQGYKNLRKGNVEEFVPGQIKSMLDKIADGTAPFDADKVDALETVFSNAIKTAQRAGDGNTVQAVKALQKALLDTPIEGNLPTEAMKAFREARKFSRKMYTWRESVPAIADIVDGVSPDNFMQKYILGSGDKASVQNVQKLANQLSGDKEAINIVKHQIMAYFMNAAQPGTNMKVNAASLRNAINKVGDRKLSAFFTPKEIAELRAISRVAQYEADQPAGSAVNNSNTAANLLGRLYDFVSKLPMVGFTSRLAVETAAPIVRSAKNASEAKQALSPNVGMRMLPQQRNAMVPAAAGAYVPNAFSSSDNR